MVLDLLLHMTGLLIELEEEKTMVGCEERSGRAVRGSGCIFILLAT